MAERNLLSLPGWENLPEWASDPNPIEWDKPSWETYKLELPQWDKPTWETNTGKLPQTRKK